MTEDEMAGWHHSLDGREFELRKGTPLASRVAQGVSGPSSSCVWNPRVFADDARGWQCPFGIFIARTNVEAETPIIWPPDMKS